MEGLYNTSRAHSFYHFSMARRNVHVKARFEYGCHRSRVFCMRKMRFTYCKEHGVKRFVSWKGKKAWVYKVGQWQGDRTIVFSLDGNPNY
jgi:hypothetical protein